jgi:phosphopantothenoylcysteine decarboxylase/phosphopantothenate--cysteine ligase
MGRLDHKAVGLAILVTAGGTREFIDPVRVIANLSTGALGRAIAAAARRRGHRVTLLAPPDLEPPRGVGHRPFVTTADLERELRRAARSRWDAVIHAAAVSDYRPAKTAAVKLRSDAPSLTLALVRTPKLIARLRRWFARAVLVGFKLTAGATRAERLRLAREQLRRHRTDVCVANDTKEMRGDWHPALIADRGGALFLHGTKADLASAIVLVVERWVRR